MFVKPQNDTDAIWLQYWIHDNNSVACYDVDLNTTAKTWLSFNLSIVYQVSWPNGYGCRTQFKGPSTAVGKNLSFWNYRFRSLQLEEAHANEINHDIHFVNTLFKIKVR